MPQTAADILIDTLVACGAEMIFGLPGDGIGGSRRLHGLRLRQVDRPAERLLGDHGARRHASADRAAVEQAATYGAQHVRGATLVACRSALTARGVAHRALPADVQDQTVEDDEPAPRHVAEPRIAFSASVVQPLDAAIEASGAGVRRRNGRPGRDRGAAAPGAGSDLAQAVGRRHLPC